MPRYFWASAMTAAPLPEVVVPTEPGDVAPANTDAKELASAALPVAVVPTPFVVAAIIIAAIVDMRVCTLEISERMSLIAAGAVTSIARRLCRGARAPRLRRAHAVLLPRRRVYRRLQRGRTTPQRCVGHVPRSATSSGASSRDHWRRGQHQQSRPASRRLPVSRRHWPRTR